MTGEGWGTVGQHGLSGAAHRVSTNGAIVQAEAPQRPSLLRCWLMLAWIKSLLRVSHYGGTLAWIRKRVEQIPPTSAAEMEAVRGTERVVAMAAALYPGRARCLEQSLTLYYILRRRGVAAQFCQGVQPYPFQAHAWIEYLDQVINDVPEHALQFARFPPPLP